jgi:hypothetical protein
VADGVRHALEDGGRVRRLNSYESGDSTHERRGSLILTLACGYGGSRNEVQGRRRGPSCARMHKAEPYATFWWASERVIARTFRKLFGMISTT